MSSIYLEDDLEPFLSDNELIPAENRSNNILVKRNRNATKNFNQTTKRAVCRTSEHESQQYEQDESEIWWHHQLQRYFCCAAFGSSFIPVLLQILRR